MVSMGVFQITVDPTSTTLPSLFNANAGMGWVAYPGWNPSAGTLTSPVLYDVPNTPSGNPGTEVSRSAAVTRSSLASPPYFPVTLGSSVVTTVASYSQLHQPAVFAGAYAVPAQANGTREVFTEINSFTLSLNPNTYNTSPLASCSCAVPGQTPCFTYNGPSFPMVMAGYENTYVDPSVPGGKLPRSLGLIQSQQNGETIYNSTYSVNVPYTAGVGNSAYDLPANSFFNVYVEVALPQAGANFSLNTASASQFPTQGAILYSSQTQPLIIQDAPPNNTQTLGSVEVPEPLCGLPPSVVYWHAPNTFAPKLFFTEQGLQIPGSSPPDYYWLKDEYLGSLVLGGHGTFGPCDPETNFIAQVLGTTNAAAQPMPISYPVPTTSFPCPGVSYQSIQGVNLGGATLDAVNFNAGGPRFWIRDLVLDGFVSPISLPTTGNSVVYSDAATPVTCEISVDGTNYVSASGLGPVQIKISNPNGPVGNTTYYTLQVLEMSLTCNSPDGTFYLQQSTATNSYGTHILQTSGSAAPLVASYINQQFQFSSDGEVYYDANRALYLEMGNAPCGASQATLLIEIFGSGVAVVWHNPNYKLQGTASLAGTPIWVDIPGTSPITIPFPSPYNYFRVVCQ